MSDILLHVAVGVLATTLIAFAGARLLWSRAVRLTTRRLEYRIPSTISEIIAAQDMIRAEHAVAMRGLERTISVLRGRLVTAEAAAATADAERERLAGDMGNRRAVIERLEGRVRELETAVQDTARAEREATDARAVAFRERDDARTQLEVESRHLAETRVELDAQRLRLVAVETENENLKLARDKALKDVADTRQAVDSLRAEIEAERQSFEMAQAELKTALVAANMAVEKSAADLAEARRALDHSEEKLSRAKDERGQLEARVAEMQTSLDAAQERDARDSRRNERLSEELDDARQGIQTLKSRISEIEQERERLAKALEEAAAARTGAVDRAEREKRRADRLAQDMQALEENTKTATQNRQREKNRIAEAIAKAEAARDEARASEKRTKEQLAALNRTLQAHPAGAAASDDELAKLRAEKMRLEAQFAQLRTEWSAREQQLKRNAETIAARASGGENVSLIARLDSLADEIALFAGTQLPAPGKDTVTPLSQRPGRPATGTAPARETAGATG